MRVLDASGNQAEIEHFYWPGNARRQWSTNTLFVQFSEFRVYMQIESCSALSGVDTFLCDLHVWVGCRTRPPSGVTGFPVFRGRTASRVV